MATVTKQRSFGQTKVLAFPAKNSLISRFTTGKSHAKHLYSLEIHFANGALFNLGLVIKSTPTDIYVRSYGHYGYPYGLAT